MAVFNDDEAAGNDELTGESVKGVITFKGDAPTALVKVAISSVSCENALANLRTELSHWDFDEVRNEAIDKWNDQLSCISIDTKDERANLVYAIKVAVKNDGMLKIGMYGGVDFND